MSEPFQWSRLVWGSPQWAWPAAILGLLALISLAAAYRGGGARSQPRVRWLAASFKAIALTALAVCLLEPQYRGVRVRPGANLFVVLADNSQSLTLRNKAGDSQSEEIQRLVGRAPWQARLGQDFEVRRYVFDRRLRNVAAHDAESLTFDGESSMLAGALNGVVQRFAHRPLAGILLLSDGNSTDLLQSLLEDGGEKLPPIYPVLPPDDAPAPDISIRRVTVRQTNFEAAPVTITGEILARGFDSQTLLARLIDADGQTVDEQTLKPAPALTAMPVELRARPGAAGLHVYRLEVQPVSASLTDTPSPESLENSPVNPDGSPSNTVENIDKGGPASGAKGLEEATQANNQRLVLVHRRSGPYRLLYLAGRPNWEFKFLRRAAEEDDEIDLVGILRIARREPKFQFQDRDTGGRNQFFNGIDTVDPDDVEQYDQPVLVRIGVEDEVELREGFPKTADELYRYHAVILDDLEAQFFTPDQMSLLQSFVSARGGGLLMLGGESSFASGRYDRTPIGEMLPVYVDDSPSPPDALYRLSLTREGWLQPWVRMRSNETDERARLAEMPDFRTLNVSRRVKPGASVLATGQVRGSSESAPILISQRFGEGRAAALMIGDFWRWALERPANRSPDLERSWRQTLRWLVSEVPGPVEAEATRDEEGGIRIAIDVRDSRFAPQDNAEVNVRVTTPEGKTMEAPAVAGDQPGQYTLSFTPRAAGAYRVKVSATGPDGNVCGEGETGWTTEPSAEEFAELSPNLEVLKKLAEQSGGETTTAADLDELVASLSRRKAPIEEPWLYPLWHRWSFFLLASLCLAGEWGLRRWHGMP